MEMCLSPGECDPWLGRFGPEDRVAVDFYELGEDGMWYPRADLGWLGTVTQGSRFMAETGEAPCLQVYPAEGLPRGAAYANRVPWDITGEPFWAQYPSGDKTQLMSRVRFATAEEAAVINQT